MKEHIMKLAPYPFEMIRNGKKTIELRLYDEKRKSISNGDRITFVNTDDDNDLLRVKVENMFVFNSFEELYKKLPLLECGYTENDVSMASPDDMNQYYSKDKQMQCGVVGIKIRLI